jgi:hypothetical protein
MRHSREGPREYVPAENRLLAARTRVLTPSASSWSLVVLGSFAKVGYGLFRGAAIAILTTSLPYSSTAWTMKP